MYCTAGDCVTPQNVLKINFFGGKVMELKPATCPNCGGKLELDPSNEKGICKFCKTEIIVADAIQKFKGEVEGIATQKSRLTRAAQMLDGEDYDGAIKAYKLLLEANPDNHEAWWGLFNCDVAVAEFHLNRNGYSTVERNKCIAYYRDALATRGKWALEYAPSDKKALYEAGIDEVKKKIDDLTPSPEPEKKSGCYIATAVYGSYDAPEVLYLRQYRDDVLSKSVLGRVFIRAYYILSPPIAQHLENTHKLNNTVRKLLDRFTQKIRNN